VRALDHSETYQKLTLRNLGHMWRASAIVRTVRRLGIPQGGTYCDIGCSNGYLTARVSAELSGISVRGFDHNEENLKVARGRYPDIDFSYIDLNHPTGLCEVATFVTCFETMEHVGNIQAALDNVASIMKPGARLLMTVPIESGLIGAAKYIIKRRVFGYGLSELSDDPAIWREYERAVLRGQDISRFRSPRDGWGTHFGFDYRSFEKDVRQRFPDLHAWTVGTSRFLTAIR